MKITECSFKKKNDLAKIFTAGVHNLLKANRGCQPLLHNHHVVGTVVLRDMRWTLYAPDYAQDAMHHTLLQSHINTLSLLLRWLLRIVIITTTNWAAILRVLWCHTNRLKGIVNFKNLWMSPEQLRYAKLSRYQFLALWVDKFNAFFQIKVFSRFHYILLCNL